ncbi:MAG: PEP-CTERM sorting domain-containing protein [Planctomycetes bacterium]|nr:PEP-CTERM sorting domain-containing protein [Planctomycetota bacterium]
MRYTVYLLAVCLVSSAGAEIVWDYESPLTVVEDITDIGGGEYRYEYSFLNEDTLPITTFGVYTRFEAQVETTFTGFEPTWGGGYFFFVYHVGHMFDGRILDEAIVGFSRTENCLHLRIGTVCPGEAGIQPGQSVEGFSFIASVYDASPKYYFYSTPDSGYAAYTGRFAAVGTTVPEPMSLLLLSFGGLAFLKTRRQFRDF